MQIVIKGGYCMAFQNFIKISANKNMSNAITLPQPRRGLNLKVATIVDSSRNAKGEVIGQKVGRDQQKIDNLQWAYLPASTWSNILKMFDKNFFVYVQYYDMVYNKWTIRRMYPGDRSATPYWLNKNTGKPTHYVDCKVNLVDVGGYKS